MTIPPIGALSAGVPMGSLGAEAAQGAGGEGLAAKALGTGEAQGTSPASGEGGFAGTLSQALESLEHSLAQAGTAAAAVSTGTTSNPEAAIVSVQNAELEMQLASQIRTKATEAVQTIFQTQV